MKKYKIVVFLTLIAISVSVIFSLILSKYGLHIEQYALETSLKQKVRIVHLTDQHNSIFGNNNSNLITKIFYEKPDLICITGDQINQNSTLDDINQACNLIAKLSEIAPVYIAYGNHESAWNRCHETDSIQEQFENAGATVLEYEWKDITVNGTDIRIGGIYGYCLPDTYTGEFREDECNFLHDFEDTDNYTILLCHVPVCWIKNHGLDSWDIDLILSGHVHGGQVRIPFIGGLYAPDMGWFPGNVKGVYSSIDGTHKMVLSSGLGSYDKLPRFNNIPEIVVIDLVNG